jgi:hypothetical protein
MLTQRVQQDEEMLRQCRDQEERVSSLQRHVETALENKSHEIRDVIGVIYE